MDTSELDREQALARMREISTELERLGKFDTLTGAQQRRFDELRHDWRDCEQRTATLEREADLDRIRDAASGGGGLRLESGAGNGGYDPDARAPGLLGRGDPWADDQPTVFGESRGAVVAEQCGRARTAIEQLAHCPDDGRQKITAALDAEGGENLSRLARWTIATSDPAYTRAFAKLARDPLSGHHEFDDAELRAFRRVASEARAMSLTDAAGGYLVPFQLDPTVIVTSSGSTNPLRAIARIVIATGDVWNGVSSAGVVSAWYAEGAEVTDDAPTLAQPTVPVHKQMSWIPVSFEAFADAANIVTEVSKLLADAAEQTDAAAFQTGTGTGQPTGIVTALTGTASEVNQTGTTLDAADAYAVQEALGPRFQPSAAWIMHLVSMNRYRSVIAGTGLTTPMLDDSTTPPRLLGKPVYEASFMDSSVTAAASDYLAVYGAWDNYVIADRIGTTVELVPNLMGANRRPTGQRGWLMWRRVGADSVNDNAFRMLDKSA